MARALVDMPESWNTPLAKFKNHYEYALAASRATGHEPAAEKVVFSLEALNFRAFGANSPAGFEDTASYWSSPDAIMKRLEWAQALSRKVKRDINAMPLAEATIGPVMKPDTRFAISGAPSREDGIALVLVSPEFQRR